MQPDLTAILVLAHSTRTAMLNEAQYGALVQDLEAFGIGGTECLEAALENRDEAHQAAQDGAREIERFMGRLAMVTLLGLE